MNSNESKLCQGKDVFERMNYLYQASRFIAKKNKIAASYYGNMMTSCARKSVLRMEPEVKRTICKNCQSPLIPGETARVRLVSKPVKAIKYTCVNCSAARRIPSKKGHKLWIEEPESLVQLYDYTPKIPADSKPLNNPPVQKTTDSPCIAETKIQDKKLWENSEIVKENKPP